MGAPVFYLMLPHESSAKKGPLNKLTNPTQDLALRELCEDQFALFTAIES